MTNPLGMTQVELAIGKLKSFRYVHLQGIDWDVVQDYTHTLQTLLDEVERLKKLSLPPDHWNNAPEWATYKATDKDGAMYWYENIPRRGAEDWWPNSEDLHPPVCISHHYKDWGRSLEERPNNKEVE